MHSLKSFKEGVRKKKEKTNLRGQAAVGLVGGAPDNRGATTELLCCSLEVLGCCVSFRSFTASRAATVAAAAASIADFCDTSELLRDG